jgi:hypothetical protein
MMLLAISIAIGIVLFSKFSMKNDGGSIGKTMIWKSSMVRKML